MANIDVCKVCKKNVGYDSLEYYGEDLTCKGCCLKLLKSNIDPLSELSKRHSSGELSDEWTKEFTPLLKNKKTRSVKTDALTKFCSTCGKKIHKLAEICPKCGAVFPLRRIRSDIQWRTGKGNSYILCKLFPYNLRYLLDLWRLFIFCRSDMACILDFQYSGCA